MTLGFLALVGAFDRVARALLSTRVLVLVLEYRALDHRAECHASLYDYESALADLAELTAHHAAGVEPAILKGWSGRTLDLKTEQRRAPRSVLGVEPTATDAEIKRAFRGLCLAWHPDKHAAASADTRARAKHKFARITAAHDK